MEKKIASNSIDYEFRKTTIGGKYYEELSKAREEYAMQCEILDKIYDRNEVEGASVEELRTLSDSLYEEESRYRRERDKAFDRYEAAKNGWTAAMDDMGLIEWIDW